jgi:two-component system phosphate regulon sensor histidine kinase PhoR
VVFAVDTLGGKVLLVRQRDVRELRAAARQAVIPDGIVVSVGSWLLLVLLIMGYRFTRMRRERDLVRLRSEFVAGVSHELRTPLTQIRLFAQLVRDGTMSDPSKVERAMRVVDTEARRLTFLVDNVLGFARIEHRAPGPSGVVMNVSRDVAEAVETYAPVIEGRAKISLNLPANLRARIDPGSLRQVVLNLLDNAAKYGPEGQIIEVGATREGGDVVLWVQDAGPGIPHNAREKVFEPFVRLDPGGSAPGTGIGLAVVKELVTANGGSVVIRDGTPGGTRVEVRLPAESDNVSGERYAAFKRESA